MVIIFWTSRCVRTICLDGPKLGLAGVTGDFRFNHILAQPPPKVLVRIAQYAIFLTVTLRFR